MAAARSPGRPPESSQRLFLKPGWRSASSRRRRGAEPRDYWSDPSHPVTYVPRPTARSSYEDDHWKAWLTTDQRNVSSRPDVLTFTGPVLTAPVTSRARRWFT